MNKLTRTAPKRVWLQISDDEDHFDEPFPHGSEVTWCADSVQMVEVEYVRADIAREAIYSCGKMCDNKKTRALRRVLGDRT